jgi:hypothetical protein
MKLIDYEKTSKEIKKMSLADKQMKILEIKEKGFRYANKEIDEIIKDKWVFLKSGSDTDIVEIDYIILDWTGKEEQRIEREEAKSGKTIIDKYFKKYGTLSLKEESKDCYLYRQTVYFDGKATPGGLWNTRLFMYRLGVYKSHEDRYSNDASYVKFYADMKIENSMDAKMDKNEPTLRHCHDWYTSPHKKCENHYKHENWLEDIQVAKNKFMAEVEKFTNDFESFQYNSRSNLYCASEKFVFWFEEEADHNGDITSFFKSEIYSKNKYKGSAFRNNTRKVPTKFDKIIGRGELLELAAKYCEDKLTKHEFRKEFKY